MDRYAEADLDPEPGERLSTELAVTDDVLLKAFALGPGAELQPHEHPEATNVFHVLDGTVTVVQGEVERRVTAPGVVVHEPGVTHGARNDTEAVATFTATLSPVP